MKQDIAVVVRDLLSYQELVGKMSKELLAVKEAGMKIRLASQ